jgi:hypothetical protein
MSIRSRVRLVRVRNTDGFSWASRVAFAPSPHRTSSIVAVAPDDDTHSLVSTSTIRTKNEACRSVIVKNRRARDLAIGDDGFVWRRRRARASSGETKRKETHNLTPLVSSTITSPSFARSRRSLARASKPSSSPVSFRSHSRRRPSPTANDHRPSFARKFRNLVDAREGTDRE